MFVHLAALEQREREKTTNGGIEIVRDKGRNRGGETCRARINSAEKRETSNNCKHTFLVGIDVHDGVEYHNQDERYV